MKEEKEELYDVLKDNPRWKSAQEKEADKQNNNQKNIPSEIKEEDNVISDVKNPVSSSDNVSQFLYDDEKSEIREENRQDFSSEEYLNQWKNEDAVKANQQRNREEIQARKNTDFQFQKSNSKKIVALLWIVAIVIVLVSVLSIFLDTTSRINNPDETANSPTLEVSTKPQLDDSDDFVENGKYTVEGVAKAVRSSIVEIYCYETDDDYINKNVYGTGSGIILSSDGYIVTNTHVLDGASAFAVCTDDDVQYIAQIAGKDTKTDIAVLKIDAANLNAANIGDSDDVSVGEEVVAIGNPAGLSGTVTNGIVSALNRKIKSDSTGFEMDCIQTNAAISPGNSGGALVNMYGQVIGITSSKYSNSSYEGLGFAITINQALPIINQLIINGYVDGRVKIGIKFISTDSTYSRNQIEEEIGCKLPDSFDGLWITEISEDCDIANTELEINDFIISLNGTKVKNYDELYAVISDCKAGDIVEAECIRFDENGDEKAFSISFALSSDTSGDY